MAKQPEFDPRTRARIEEHFTNPNDTITEQDIRNVKTDIGSLDKNPEPVPTATLTDKELKEEDSAADPGIDSSWNILK